MLWSRGVGLRWDLSPWKGPGGHGASECLKSPGEAWVSPCCPHLTCSLECGVWRERWVRRLHILVCGGVCMAPLFSGCPCVCVGHMPALQLVLESAQLLRQSQVTARGSWRLDRAPRKHSCLSFLGSSPAPGGAPYVTNGYVYFFSPVCRASQHSGHYITVEGHSAVPR